mmetsp:Transcript_9401/g.28074  ORF Transcript_9401/g.28074 Transcript_9401/m.28074 type:complete len:126 (+) Transcript_9401:1801-2178(+)
MRTTSPAVYNNVPKHMTDNIGGWPIATIGLFRKKLTNINPATATKVFSAIETHHGISIHLGAPPMIVLFGELLSVVQFLPCLKCAMFLHKVLRKRIKLPAVVVERFTVRSMMSMLGQISVKITID